MRNSNDELEMLTPPEFGRRFRVSAAKVIGWILAGELAAINVANAGSRRPRYRISRESAQEFERRRNVLLRPRPARRRRQSAAVKEFV